MTESRKPAIGSLQSPADLLSTIDLFTTKDRDPNSALEKKLNGGSFSWINVATTDIPIGRMLNVVRNSELVNPPRTLHLGGVHYNIARGGGGSVALNNPVFNYDYGYPLVFDLNETPDDGHRKGDTLYWPGTLFYDRGHQNLPLYTWDGSEFTKRDRSSPLFVPLVMTEVDGSLVALTTVHKQDMMNLGGKFNYQYLSKIVLENKPFVKQILCDLLQLAQSEDDVRAQKNLLSLIADRVVDLSGISSDRPLSCLFGGNFKIGDYQYGSVEDVVDLLLLPLKIATDPSLLNNIGKFPKQLPRLSKEMIITLMAVLNTDFYEQYNNPLRPVNPHFHWGAFQMAGAPPLLDGYFAGSASGIRNLLSAMRACGNCRDLIPPIYYVLLPAAMFTLFPSEKHSNDVEAVNELVERVKSTSDPYLGQPNLFKNSIGKVVEDWWFECCGRLSLYFISRFSKYDSTKTNHVPQSPILVKPDNFDELGFRQAAMTVGFLKTIVQ